MKRKTLLILCSLVLLAGIAAMLNNYRESLMERPIVVNDLYTQPYMMDSVLRVRGPFVPDVRTTQVCRVLLMDTLPTLGRWKSGVRLGGFVRASYLTSQGKRVWLCLQNNRGPFVRLWLYNGQSIYLNMQDSKQTIEMSEKIGSQCFETSMSRSHSRLFRAKNLPEDSTIAIVDLELQQMEYTEKPYPLSHKEARQALQLLRVEWEKGNCNHTFWKDENGDKYECRGEYKPYPYDDYFKQLVAYKEKGHLMVAVMLSTHWRVPNGVSIRQSLSMTLILVNDGGKHYGQAVIDLTTKQVKEFRLNGVA